MRFLLLLSLPAFFVLGCGDDAPPMGGDAGPTCGPCTTPPNATDTCNGRMCDFVCLMGFEDCDGDPANGCELDVSSDADNCGACGASCTDVNGTAMCVESDCALTCDTGFGDCDVDGSNGCEADTDTDRMNCGVCGMTCESDESCDSGGCVPAFGLEMRVDSPCDVTMTPPMMIGDTNCYADVPTQEPAAGLIPYVVTSNLWADGTLKRRFLVMPDTTSTITYRDEGGWGMPEGTILVKEFWLQTIEDNPDSLLPLETRFMVRRPAGWTFHRYTWNEEGTDATLDDPASTADYTVMDVGGGSSTYTHVFPGAPDDCARCHIAGVGTTLGMRAVQMNRDHDYDGIVDNQLRTYEHLGLFGDTLPDTPDMLPSMPIPSDDTASLEDRARSYLEGNCAHCHNPEGAVPTVFDLRYQTPFMDARLCDQSVIGDTLGITDPRIIIAGNPDRSMLLQRDLRRDMRAMPPLGTLQVDDFGTMLVSDWIMSIGACP